MAQGYRLAGHARECGERCVHACRDNSERISRVGDDGGYGVPSIAIWSVHLYGWERYLGNAAPTHRSAVVLSFAQDDIHSTRRRRRCGSCSAERQISRSPSSGSRCQSGGMGTARRREVPDSKASQPLASARGSAMRMPWRVRRCRWRRSALCAGAPSSRWRRSTWRRSPHEGMTSHALQAQSSSPRKSR